MEQCIKDMEASPEMSLTGMQAELDQEMNFELPDFLSKSNSKATEYDRFIPQRQ